MTSDSSSVLESSVLVAPVTALEFLGDDCLLTGDGPVLSVFCLQASPRHCASLSVLHNYYIHGIRAKQPNKDDGNEEAELVVFGGKGVRLISVMPHGHGLEVVGPLLELQDWVLDVSWLKEEVHPLLGVSLAHNAVLLLEPDSGNILAFCSCVEVCLLYSALLIGPSWETSVLVGGTVFNQLVLWRPVGTKVNEQSKVERRLLGHSGVIFSLCYLQSSGWLASASDDRSVRMWHVGRLGGDGGCGEDSPTCLRVLYGHQARVFCVRLTPGRVFSAGEDGSCLLWEWGAEGRVGRTFKGHRAGGIRALAVSKGQAGGGGGWVATGGADGGICVWRLAEGNEPEKEKKGGETQIDLRFTGRGCPKVVRLVGECDSVLVCTDQGEVLLHQDGWWEPIWNGGLEFQSYCVMEVASIRFQDSISGMGVWLCAVGNLSGGIWVFSLCQPNSGMLLQAGKGKIHSLQWVEGQGAGHGLCLLASGSEGLVSRWMVWVEMEDEMGLVLRVEKLTAFLLPPCAKRWLTAAVTLPCRKGVLWVCGDRRGSLLLYREKEGDRKVEEGREGGKNAEEGCDWEHREEDAGRSAGERWRMGPWSGGDHIAAPLSPVSMLFGIHGKQGVTSVCERQRVCYSTGRDGYVRVLMVNGNTLYVRRAVRACRGMEWLEKILFLDAGGPEPHTDARETSEEECEEEEEEKMRERVLGNEGDDGEERGRNKDELCEEAEVTDRMGEVVSEGLAEARFVMAGFHSVQFALWDPLRQEKLFSVACGGGHRSWAYTPPSQTQPSSHTLSQGTLVFIKQGDVLASRSLTSTPADIGGHTLREGLHGRGLGCICHLGGVSRGGVSPKVWEVLVTAGEDTTVTILTIEPKQGAMKVLAVINDHISNVRTLAAVRRTAKDEGKGDRQIDASCAFSAMLFSAGGRAQLQCYRLLIGWDEQLSYPICQVTQIAGHRLDEHWERRRNRHKTVKMNPETRYMSMTVLRDDIEEVLLALACSDGALRLFSVKEDCRKIELLWETFYHQRCVLSVASYRLEDAQGQWHVVLFSGATDGAVALWDLSAVMNSKSKDSWQYPSAPCSTIPVHQSGVNTLILSKYPEAGHTGEDIISLASGGDDGQLSVMKIRLLLHHKESGGVFPQLLSLWSVPLAHSAPLTALSAPSPGRLVSVSPDQRVCVWCLCGDGLHHHATMFSHTADAAGLWAWQREGGAYVVVCGQGLQLVKVMEHKKEDMRRMGTGYGRKSVIADHFI
ncbi:WD repeat-containing protein 6 [Electrophorus electricus]|nr:WD repeat-containing protein 6 [Electrophorus electricus]